MRRCASALKSDGLIVGRFICTSLLLRVSVRPLTRRSLQRLQSVTECVLRLLLIELQRRAHVPMPQEFLSRRSVPASQPDDCGRCPSPASIQTLPLNCRLLQSRSNGPADHVLEALRVARSLAKSQPSVGLPHFCRHRVSGIVTCGSSGSVASDSGVFGIPTRPRTHARRICTAAAGPAISKSSHFSPAIALGRRPAKNDRAIINWQSTRSTSAEMMFSASSSV